MQYTIQNKDAKIAVLCGGIVYSLTTEELSALNNRSIDVNTTRYTYRESISDIPYLIGTKIEVIF